MFPTPSPPLDTERRTVKANREECLNYQWLHTVLRLWGMRWRRVGMGVAVASGLAGCGGPDPWQTHQILFSIEQATDESGGPVVLAGYEMLELGSRGWHTRGLVDRDKACFLERLDDRLGKLRVERGAATFRGGQLPPEGLTILANADDVVVPGRAFQSGDVLSFEASGFAAPTVDAFHLSAPSIDLDVVSPPPGDVTIDAHANWPLRWSAARAPGERVMVALRIADESRRGVEARCFFEREAGGGEVPSVLLEELRREDAGASGSSRSLRVTTHRQVTVYAADGWIQYVVAAARAREQAFTFSP
jgi:hypothetical protein